LKDQIGGAIVGKVLSSFYKSAESIGFESGGEFKAAVIEGKLVGAKILLGDRDVDITLQHLAAAFQKSAPDSLDRLATRVDSLNNQDNMGVVDESTFLNKEQLGAYVERMKQRKTLNGIMMAFKEEVPFIYEALIGERDIFMAESISTSGAKRMVSVMGIAHMAGIEKTLVAKNYKIINNVCPTTRKS
jgi:pheromone shutdown protein TraB